MKRLAIAAFACAMMLASPSLLHAGGFWVSPIRVELDASNKSGVISVANNGTDPLRLQIEASSWTQDAGGNDVYGRALDLNYYPRSLEVQPGESRVIRVGVKAPAVSVERTYRVFIREIPSAEPSNQDGLTVKVAMRFGVPVFVSPVKPVDSGAVANISAAKSVLTFDTVNTGNRSFKITKVKVTAKRSDGAQTAIDGTAGMYVHAGHTRKMTVQLPPDKCREFSDLLIEIEGNRLTFQSGVKTDASMCAP